MHSSVNLVIAAKTNVEERPFQGRVTKKKEMGFSPGGCLMQRISSFAGQAPVNAHNFHSRLYIAGIDTSD